MRHNRYMDTRNQKGQSLVELAISITFLVLLIGGIIELGSIFYTYVSLRDTAQEGAIYGSYNPTDITGIEERIHASASSPINATSISSIMVQCDETTCSNYDIHSCQGKKIRVEIAYNYHFLTPLVNTLLGSPPPDFLTLRAAVTSTILKSTDTITELSKLIPPQKCF